MNDALGSALSHAARVLVRSVLRVAPGEHVVVVEDAGSAAIGAVVAEAADACGAWVKRPRLDELTSGVLASGRPHKTLPDPLLLAMQHAHASVFVASAIHQEAPMRQALLHKVQELDIRHAHMPAITATTFLAGLRLPYEDVERVGEEVLALVERATTLTATSEAGTELSISMAGGSRWFAQLGRVEPGRWANLPAGAIYASPADVSGVFVADASLGEFFGARAGLLRGKPVRFTIERGRVTAVAAEGAPDLQRDLEAMLAFSSNSDRVGLVAIGVNHGISAPIGDASLDQNVPGLHLGIGDPAGSSTGATWSAPTCFAACEAASTVSVDGELVIQNGKLAGRVAAYAARAFRPTSGVIAR